MYIYISGVYLKADSLRKLPTITVIFAGCSLMCAYAYMLSEGQFSRLFPGFFRM